MERNMGNEDKVKYDKHEIDRSSSNFLPEEIKDIDAQAEVYSLDKEFAKTKKNKNYKVHLFVAGFVLVIVGLTYLYTASLNENNLNVEVDIKEFEDLRLKEVLQSARSGQNNVELFKMQLQILRVEMLNAVLGVRKDYLNRELALVAQELPQGQLQEKVSVLREGEKKTVKNVQARYTRRIRNKRAQIWDIETELKAEQKKINDKKKSGFFQNEDRLYKLKMKKLRQTQKNGVVALKNYYENLRRFVILKYNPVFRSAKLKTVISQYRDDKAIEEISLHGYRQSLKTEVGITQSNFNDLRTNIDRDLRLIKRMLNVPYKNSVSPAIKAIDGSTRNIVKDYEKLWSGLAVSLDGKTNQLEAYKYAFRRTLESSNLERGYVLDGRNEKNVLVHMLNSSAIQTGDAATLIRGKEQNHVATVEFFRKDGLLRAKVIEKPQGSKLEPLDKIIMVSAGRGK